MSIFMCMCVCTFIYFFSLFVSESQEEGTDQLKIIQSLFTNKLIISTIVIGNYKG